MGIARDGYFKRELIGKSTQRSLCRKQAFQASSAHPATFTRSQGTAE
jgi:hypothetical protein